MRVSTENQEQEETIDNQFMELKERIEKDFPGYVLSPDLIYKDEGWSGSILERPEMDKLRADAKDEMFDILYFYDRGRISRIFIHQEIIIGELREANVQLVGLHDINGVSDEERLMGSVMGIFQEYERLKIAERMRIGKLRKVRENKKLLGYQPKYGYDYLNRIKKGENARDSEFVINEKRAEVVRLVFEWCDNGMTKYGIQEELYKRGIMPLKAKRDVWSTSVIDRLLRDTTYKGEHYYNKNESAKPKNPRKIEKYNRNPKSSRIARDKKDWYMVKVPPIVSPELFDRVQVQLARNKSTYDRKNSRTHKYLVGGIVECVCGQRRTGDPAGGHAYYRCNDRSNHRLGTRTCYEHGVNTEVLDYIVWKNVSKLLTNPELVLHYAKKWQQGVSPLEVRVVLLENQLKDLDEKEKRITLTYAEGVTTEQLYRETIYGYNQRRAAIVSEINTIKDELANKPLLPLEKLVEGVIKLTQDLDYLGKKEIIQKVVSKVIATKQEVTVWGYIPVLADGEIGLNDKYSEPYNPTQCDDVSKESEIGLNVKHRNRRLA